MTLPDKLEVDDKVHNVSRNVNVQKSVNVEKQNDKPVSDDTTQKSVQGEKEDDLFHDEKFHKNPQNGRRQRKKKPMLFRGHNHPCSNRFPIKDKLSHNAVPFDTSEHLFQYQHEREVTNDDQLAEKIRKAESAAEAQKLGEALPGNRKWDQSKELRMRDIINQKMRRCIPARNAIRDSDGGEIIEATSDMYWGCGLKPNEIQEQRIFNGNPYPGENRLGKILGSYQNNLPEIDPDIKYRKAQMYADSTMLGMQTMNLPADMDTVKIRTYHASNLKENIIANKGDGDVSVVHCHTGLNDVDKGKSADLVAKNIIEGVEAALECHTSAKVIVSTIPPMANPRKNNIVIAVNRKIRQAMGKHTGRVQVLSFSDVITSQDDFNGIHFRTPAAIAMYEIVQSAINMV